MEALPLRTGRTNCVTNMQRDMAEQTLAIIASMMQQAAHDATLYCAEARRTVILPRDIELALKRLVLPGSAYWTRDDLPEEARQIRQRLFADTGSSEEESDSGDSWVTEIGDTVSDLHPGWRSDDTKTFEVDRGGKGKGDHTHTHTHSVHCLAR
jgi:histone H3/H4